MRSESMTLVHLCCAAIVVSSLIGCSGGEPELPRAAVEGDVSLDGQPLKTGVIRFVPTDGTEGPKTSVIITNGRFEVDEEYGPIVGNHRIEIESSDDGGFAPDDEQSLEQLHASGTLEIDVLQIPESYNRQSTLTETVTAEGPNQYQFTLNSSGSPWLP